jgi:hypothetical protein
MTDVKKTSQLPEMVFLFCHPCMFEVVTKMIMIYGKSNFAFEWIDPINSD